MSSVGNPSFNTEQISATIRRICEHFSIAFAANRLLPSLADMDDERTRFDECDRMNLVGRSFGIRFRELNGDIRDIRNTVENTGPVMIGSFCSPDFEPLLIMASESGGKFTIFEDGQNKEVSSRVLRAKIAACPDSRWYLIQPLLLAEDASRFHYQTGETREPIKPLRRFVAMLKPDGNDIRNILVFSLVVGLLSLTLPLAVEAIVNTIAFGRYLQPLIVLSLIVMVFLAFRAGLKVLLSVVAEIIQRKLFVRTVEDLSYRLTRVPLATWQKYHGPELVNRFFDIVTVQKVTAKLLLDTLMLALQTIIGLTVLAFYHPFLLGYDIGLLIMMTVVLYFIGRGAVRTAIDESQSKYETAAWLQEIVRHPSTFKYNGGLGFAINRADELAARYINHRQLHFQILIRQITFAMTMQVIAATVLLALGGYLVIERQMNLGQLVAAELIVTVILGSFAKVGKDLENFYDLMASVDKLGKLFDLPVETSDKLQIVRQPGAYSMTLIDFQHDGSPANVDIEFGAGDIYSLYGPSGLQRRRLIEVFVGQDKPSNGHVLLNDFRVDAIAAESLQEKISLVREIELFEGTVDENLRLGRANVGSAEVNEIVNRLGLRRTLVGLEKGFATRLSISGYPLSPDQAIRLVVARALITKPGILIVDGLLDRLSDEEAEDLLPCLNGFAETTTIIIATGRRSIARWSNKCVDLKKANWLLEEFDG